ncbi:uncharacterized protein LOC111314705 [Durio zibethinus]|uniref:Uncharacterized protein LOC111314705 n=1 Tax=Durio zibethinus TaxID=66656 RepID=A0A6P6B4K7_DURZI|nr:uncharacterized protein LOC111314705 [Durio zibethinus]
MGRHYIPLTIPFGLKELWNEWSIRGAILFSPWLQIVLIFMAPIRKSTRATWVISLIWYAYLLADATANFALGLISNSQQRNRSNNPESKPKESSDLLAFWAPFLILHLGGPDTITAFSLEDNQLWKRHLLLLSYQVATVFYVFSQSFPNENLWIPTVLMFIAGIIKYVERTVALRLASLDIFRDSMLKQPDPGANYARLMNEYASRREAEPSTRLTPKRRPDAESKTSDVPTVGGHLNNLDVVHYAFKHFQVFKGLIVDLIFSNRELYESRKFFNWRTAEDALRIIEVELNMIYDALYTKVEVVNSIAGYISRFIAFGLVFASSGLFYFQAKKDEYHGVDIRITYTLLLGAIALDVISFLMLISSDRIFASIGPHSSWAALLCNYLALKKPRWHPCKCKIKNSGSERNNVKHHVLANPLVCRRWSGSVPGHNLIRYCLKSSSTTIHEFPGLCEFLGCVANGNSFKGNVLLCCYMRKAISFIRTIRENVNKFFSYVIRKITMPIDVMFRKFRKNTMPIEDSVDKRMSKASSFIRSIQETPVFRKFPMPIKDFVDKLTYVSSEPFTRELWEFIFGEQRAKSEFADTPEIAQWVSSARGDWVLADHSKLLKYVTDVQYEESLLLWHIATDLCYNTDDEKVTDSSYREFSKILSDYMLYLLVFQPTMMSAAAGIGKKRFRDTCAEAERFFQSRSLGPNEDKKACEAILSVNTDYEPVTVKGNISKSVLFDASMLAKELNRMETEDGEEKWKLLSKVWVELVSYAANHCRASTLAKEVSNSGEFINFVWLLMAHFGIGAQFQTSEGHAGERYYGKDDMHHTFYDLLLGSLEVRIRIISDFGRRIRFTFHVCKLPSLKSEPCTSIGKVLKEWLDFVCKLYFYINNWLFHFVVLNKSEVRRKRV